MPTDSQGLGELSFGQVSAPNPPSCQHPKKANFPVHQFDLFIGFWVASSWPVFSVTNRLTDLENEFMVTREEEGRGGREWEFGIDTYTLLYLK